ncbi:RNA polymerase, sigma-24 subunit, ECF subfamily protein [Limosilactobacillus frumenti DSM 13145]|uniref:RNA polymerase, sigma-24 subunit, ECF subfamily protein n=1 Tax=Limosilactobacillus frumenti DSM 13145 TaxID=1423746 RepID=A0A0R1P7S5_9LACO|nr:sigma-70 family RNA polymerase sigma factor [Limosilactobacillus frumenti]KRL28528.1 RNA polymerase, sigma-24 subunit, ECF subfamily protein [Limosilactobacillus frumenti DSM 13145]MBA2914547.1 sigma-70 family RNA polymerase sigma factor [Limosilactobacillus frumenti]QFG72144.1 sigma-70 family RNA polymerase sigma factor [Limosilactobacillus frumenti]
MKFVEPKTPTDHQDLLIVQRLLLQAQLGDEESFTKLFVRYEPLIRKVWRQHYGAEIEYADWKQEAFIILFRVLEMYPQLDCHQFGSYYKRSLIHRHLDLCRNRQANKRIPQNSLFDLSDYLEELAIHTANDTVEEISYCHFCLQELIRASSSFEREVLMLLNSGQTTDQVSTQLNCSRRKVESAVNRLRLKTLQIMD